MSDRNAELIERLEKAEAGSLELSDEVMRATHNVHDGPYAHWPSAARAFGWNCLVTTSLDAALALAERVIQERGPIDLSICGSAQVVIHHNDPCGNPLAMAFGNTPALALTIAILKARATQQETSQ
jgi:hypothetical protein